MARYKRYDYSQTEMVAIDFSSQILPGTFEFTINYLIDNEIDLSMIDEYYKNEQTGAPAYNPAIMLKIILFAYSKGIYSSRKIEHSCQTNIIFKALSANSKPDFTTIASFIRNLKHDIIKIFRDVLLVCAEMNLIGGEMFAVDGRKISSNASKEWSGKFSDLKRKSEKIGDTIEYLLEKHKRTDVEEKKTKNNKDREKNQIEKIKRKKEKIDKFLSENKPKIGNRGLEMQSNITDNESGKLKSSHGIIQGYNSLALTDAKNQVVIYPEAFGKISESDFFQDMIEGGKDLLTSIGFDKDCFKDKIVIADTGNFSEENIKYLEDEKIDGYIPDNKFRNRDSRFAHRERYKQKNKKKCFRQEDFEYRKNTDEFICPNGKILTFEKIQRLGNNQGRRYKALKGDCLYCSIRNKCLRSENAKRRTLYISRPIYTETYSEKMKNKIDTDQARDIYSKRMGIVEPVFSNICYCKGLNRFTLRTKIKVNTQWILFCMIHNIGKILKYANWDKLISKKM